ncbi:MAG: hypothetical protein JNL82_33885 [Myxococcales bacterium]|nr:hypothetical protein [Myxococcales bacterium]
MFDALPPHVWVEQVFQKWGCASTSSASSRTSRSPRYDITIRGGANDVAIVAVQLF